MAQCPADLFLVALQQILGRGGRAGVVVGEEGHEFDRDADPSATRIGHRLGQPVFASGLAHLPQYMPMSEPANQGGVIAGQFGDDVLDPGQHPFDADLDRPQDADRDEQCA